MRIVIGLATSMLIALLCACTGDNQESATTKEPSFVGSTASGDASGSGAQPEIVSASQGGNVTQTSPAGVPPGATDTASGGLTVKGSASAVVDADDAFVVALVQGRTAGPVPPSASLSGRDQGLVLEALQAQGFGRDDVRFESNLNYGPFATIAVHVPTTDLAASGKKAIDSIESVTGRSQSTGVRFGLKDCSAALASLRKQAMQNATTDAQAIAADASLSLGPIIGLSEISPAPIIYGPPQTDPCDPASSIAVLNPGSGLASLDTKPEVKLSVETTLTYSLGGIGGPSLTASGSGKATAKADEAYVLIIVVPSAPAGPFGAQALSQKQHDDIVQKLKALKIDEDDIVISTPSLGGGQTIVSVETGVDNLPQRGKDITAAVEDVIGRSQQQGVVFSHSNCAAVETEARKQALADANRRAKALADAASLTLGQLVSLSEPLVLNTPPIAGANVCDQDPADLISYGGYGISLRTFDAEPLLTITSQVSLSYAFTRP